MQHQAPTGFAGHAPTSATANSELTFNLDHSMGADHRVASEMALHVLAYNMTRVMSIMGVRPLIAAMRA